MSTTKTRYMYCCSARGHYTVSTTKTRYVYCCSARVHYTVSTIKQGMCIAVVLEDIIQ